MSILDEAAAILSDQEFDEHRMTVWIGGAVRECVRAEIDRRPPFPEAKLTIVGDKPDHDALLKIYLRHDNVGEECIFTGVIRAIWPAAPSGWLVSAQYDSRLDE